MKQTADTIEARNLPENDAHGSLESSEGKYAHLAPFQFKPGQSGNPGGRQKNDTAADIARAIFRNNPEAVYKALGKALLKGNAYAFTQLADRAFGKLKESVEVTHPESEIPDADVNKRIADLERELGLARAIDEAGRAGIAQAGASKTNGKAKDTDLLPQ